MSLDTTRERIRKRWMSINNRVTSPVGNGTTNEFICRFNIRRGINLCNGLTSVRGINLSKISVLRRG
jgi:hypothetical protein